MSTIQEHKIKCANSGCKQGFHHTVGEVKDCFRGVTPAQSTQSAAVVQSPLPAPPVVEPNYMISKGQGYATGPQLGYVNDLGGDLKHAWNLSWKGCSHYIEELKRTKNRSTPVTTAPNRQKINIPQPFLEQLRDGYFAARQDATRPWTFLRISRPDRGQYKGALKVQTVHGAGPGFGTKLKLALVIYDFATEKQRIYWSDMSIEDDLLLVCVDQRGSALAYAENMKRCMRCNAELTDPRSQWYSIGPECEDYWPQIIEEVNETKGIYKPGMVT